jgi:hypothetical protein
LTPKKAVKNKSQNGKSMIAANGVNKGSVREHSKMIGDENDIVNVHETIAGVSNGTLNKSDF